MKISVSKIAPKGKDYIQIAWNRDILESRLVKENLGAQILEMKLPEMKDFSRRHFVLLARQIIFFAKKYGVKKIILDWKIVEELKLKDSREILAEILATNLEMANYEFVKYKTPPKKGWNFVLEIAIISNENNLKKFIEKGQLIGKEINATRELSNTPGGVMTPDFLAREIKKAAKGTKVNVRILEERDMKKLGMGAILGVSHGSSEKPKFIILEYNGKSEKNPLVLVGKAITFDSGGLSLKPAEYLLDMHMDMSGGAAVVHAIVTAAKLGVKKRIVGLIPAAENMPSGSSFRPGDILKSMSGKTIEILNTDAEGRLILADALTYAEKYNPRLVIDVATLTGAALVALGERASAIFSKNEKLISEFRELGELSGDYVWPLPLWEEYETEIKGTNGDVANLKTKGNERWGGSINGAIFLYQFAKKFKDWVHIDIAPKTIAVFDEYLAKGSPGSPVRLLIKVIEKY